MKGIFLPLSPDDAVVQGQVSGPGQMKPIGAAMSRCDSLRSAIETQVVYV